MTVGRYDTASGRSTQIHAVKSAIIIPTPLSVDHSQPLFLDPLTDIDPFARKWFVKYYLPLVEPVHTEWTSLVPILKAKCEERQKLNRNFQIFLKKIKERQMALEYGANDLQIDEAMNILKVRIYLSSEKVWEIHTH